MPEEVDHYDDYGDGEFPLATSSNKTQKRSGLSGNDYAKIIEPGVSRASRPPTAVGWMDSVVQLFESVPGMNPDYAEFFLVNVQAFIAWLDTEPTFRMTIRRGESALSHLANFPLEMQGYALLLHCLATHELIDRDMMAESRRDVSGYGNLVPEDIEVYFEQLVYRQRVDIMEAIKSKETAMGPLGHLMWFCGNQMKYTAALSQSFLKLQGYIQDRMAIDRTKTYRDAGYVPLDLMDSAHAYVNRYLPSALPLADHTGWGDMRLPQTNEHYTTYRNETTYKVFGRLQFYNIFTFANFYPMNIAELIEKVMPEFPLFEYADHLRNRVRDFEYYSEVDAVETRAERTRERVSRDKPLGSKYNNRKVTQGTFKSSREYAELPLTLSADYPEPTPAQLKVFRRVHQEIEARRVKMVQMRYSHDDDDTPVLNPVTKDPDGLFMLFALGPNEFGEARTRVDYREVDGASMEQLPGLQEGGAMDIYGVSAPKKPHLPIQEIPYSLKTFLTNIMSAILLGKSYKSGMSDVIKRFKKVQVTDRSYIPTDKPKGYEEDFRRDAKFFMDLVALGYFVNLFAPGM